MIMIHPMRAALVLAAMIGCAAVAARADECESMTKSVKVLIDEVGQLGALGLNDLRKLTIRHPGAFDFGALKHPDRFRPQRHSLPECGAF